MALQLLYNNYFETLRDKILEYWYQNNQPDLPLKWHRILIKYNPYYKGLTQDLKLKFLQRLFISMKSLHFTPCGFPTLSQEMPVLITSAIIQITFGLEKFSLQRFDKIYVMPNNYEYGNYGTLLGHVDHDAELIVLSWPAVKEGFIIPDDAMNVALHEIAHALMEENRFRIMWFKFFSEYHMRQWEVEAIKQLLVIRARKNNFLNSYGGQNMREMFAVCIETFFEQAEAFNENLPQLYHTVSRLLNQNPITKSNPIQI